ncbi:MAG TPA: proline dehydrogenase family protein [Actinomycetota bacterium]|nr:proline dehydrogenase family protein [Actinomycetota bacterium]
MTSHRVGRRLAGRFVAGDTLEDGMTVARSLANQGVAAMLNHLGEEVESAGQAAEAADAYVRALKRIAEEPDVDCNISVKPTQLGLKASPELCLENLDRVLQAAIGPDRRTLVMIDMEAHEYVEPTLDVYLKLRQRYSNLGVCLQSYLYRSADDAARIGGPEAIVRMAKGAYLESPDVAYQSRRDVRRNFARLAATLLLARSTVHFATHDPRLLEGAKKFIRTRSISRKRYEFQMLYGVRRDLQGQLAREGEPVRVFIPYGTQWYPYLTRRLAERPANLWFFASNLFRRGG